MSEDAGQALFKLGAGGKGSSTPATPPTPSGGDGGSNSVQPIPNGISSKVAGDMMNLPVFGDGSPFSQDISFGGINKKFEGGGIMNQHVIFKTWVFPTGDGYKLSNFIGGGGTELGNILGSMKMCGTVGNNGFANALHMQKSEHVVGGKS